VSNRKSNGPRPSLLGSQTHQSLATAKRISNAYFAADHDETCSGQVMLKVDEFADEFRTRCPGNSGLNLRHFGLQ